MKGFYTGYEQDALGATYPVFLVCGIQFITILVYHYAYYVRKLSFKILLSANQQSLKKKIYILPHPGNTHFLMRIENQASRIDTYGAVSTELALLSDRRLLTLLKTAIHVGTSIGGTTALLTINDNPIFIKKIRLTDIERRFENTMSTANLFDLPLYCQYGIGMF